MSIYDVYTDESWRRLPQSTTGGGRHPRIDLRLQALLELRTAHGFTPTRSTREWSKDMLARRLEDFPEPLHGETAEQEWRPRNAPILDFIKQRFSWYGFDWKGVEFERRGRSGKKCFRRTVLYKNFPTVNGIMPTLFDLLIVPLELVDGYRAPVPAGSAGAHETPAP